MSVVEAAEEQQLRALYDEHAPALLGYAMRLTAGDRGRAEDVVQETLVRAWRHTETRADTSSDTSTSSDTDTSLRPWLFTVAHRIAIDEHRRRRARPQEAGMAALAAVPAADEVDAGLDRILVADALSALTPEHRAVIVETYYRGRTVTEAAVVLGVPVGTVKSRTHYALRALRLALAERGVDA